MFNYDNLSSSPSPNNYWNIPSWLAVVVVSQTREGYPKTSIIIISLVIEKSPLHPWCSSRICDIHNYCSRGVHDHPVAPSLHLGVSAPLPHNHASLLNSRERIHIPPNGKKENRLKSAGWEEDIWDIWYILVPRSVVSFHFWVKHFPLNHDNGKNMKKRVNHPTANAS